MVEISTSILSVDSEKSMKTFYDLETAHTDYFHIDVMDGKFVEADTTAKMEKYSEYLNHITLIPLDVHLMVENVKEYVDKFLVFKPNTITFQIEALKTKQEVIDIIKYIQSNNCKAGIAIKPNTKIEEITEYLPYLHQVTIMTVEPGKGGQKLIECTIDKIAELKKYIEENNLDIDIEADGGININNVEKVKQAGANIIVAGTAIIDSEDFKQIINELKK
jgi:ribulose-phosphate 3-epimerase